MGKSFDFFTKTLLGDAVSSRRPLDGSSTLGRAHAHREMRPRAPGRRWSAPLVACGALVALGCGGPSSVATTIDDGTLGEDFSASEAEEFCRALENYATSQLAGGLGCKSFGITAAVTVYAGNNAVEEAALVERCESARQDCAERAATSLNCAAATAIAPCSAKIEDLEACLTDQIDETTEELSGLPDCGALTVSTVRSLAEARDECPSLPSSCKAVATSCGEALGSFGGAVRGLTVPVGVCR